MKISSILYSRKVAPYVFLSPFLILFLVFKVYPALSAILMSFQDFQGLTIKGWAGTDNYAAVYNNARFHVALGNTALYTLGILLVLIPLPLLLAVLLDSGRVAKGTVFRTLLFLPALTSLVVVGTVFRLILNPNGILNSALTSVGFNDPPSWLEVPDLIIPSLILMAAWRWTGINMIYFNSGLVNISPDLYEAASIDGAGSFQNFWYITLPLLRPTTFFVLILTIIGGFQVFVEPFVLYPGGITPGDNGLTIAMLIYRTAFTSFEFGTAAAMGVVLALIIFCFSLIQFRFFGVFQKEA